jgi:hypothetical protein
MRAAAIALLFIAMCGNCTAQKVKFVAAEKADVLQRVKDPPGSDEDRAARIRELFTEAGCTGNHLSEQPVEGGSAPNIVCELRGESDESVIVGAHYDRASSAGRPLDNWSGAALLPGLYQCLRNQKRHHSFIFVAFADRGDELVGARYFAGHLTTAALRNTEAMINLDILGLSPTKVWASHSDKDLIHALVVMVYALKLPASQIEMEGSGSTDSDPFALRQIPQITIHSLTQQTVAGGGSTSFRPNNYYDTYRLLCGYLAYLDLTLKPRPHSE